MAGDTDILIVREHFMAGWELQTITYTKGRSPQHNCERFAHAVVKDILAIIKVRSKESPTP